MSLKKQLKELINPKKAACNSYVGIVQLIRLQQAIIATETGRQVLDISSNLNLKAGDRVRFNDGGDIFLTTQNAVYYVD